MSALGKKSKAIAMCHFQILTFSYIVWYTIHWNFNVSSQIFYGPQGQISRTKWSTDHSLKNTVLLYREQIVTSIFVFQSLKANVLYPILERGEGQKGYDKPIWSRKHRTQYNSKTTPRLLYEGQSNGNLTPVINTFLAKAGNTVTYRYCHL